MMGALVDAGSEVYVALLEAVAHDHPAIERSLRCRFTANNVPDPSHMAKASPSSNL